MREPSVTSTRYRRITKRPLGVAVAISLLASLVAVASPASGLQATDQAATNDGTVVMTVLVNYSVGHCSDGQGTRDVMSVSTKFHRSSGSGRRVTRSHLLAMGWGLKCNGTPVTRNPESSYVPVFGCGGRCPSTETEAIGFSVSFPFIRDTPGGCDVACSLGGSGDGHATTSGGSPLAPNPICARVSVSSGLLPPCPDNN